ncbi:hypothetical protein ACN9U3_00530 [Staphylococcus caprae]|uniref:hypothetical protein n=1 Tax=Staphylococcus caprae TaxID=29380 RepID=UPI003B20DE51
MRDSTNKYGSNIVSTINSIHDTCEYFCNSFVSLKYSISSIETINEEERNYYWVFYFHNITLHFLHTLNDLLYSLAQEYTSHYEVKKDIGFKRNLVETLMTSNNDTHRQIGTILNKDVPIRTMRYRDEYTHNIMPYRPNSNPIVEDGITSFRGYSTMITSLNNLVEDVESDLKKIKKELVILRKLWG